jgi:hypothetical protein
MEALHCVRVDASSDYSSHCMNGYTHHRHMDTPQCVHSHVRVDVHLEHSAKKKRKYYVLVGRRMPLKARYE